MIKPVRILTVCTGNICRSPAVERLLAKGLGRFAEVTSAGTNAMVDYPMNPEMAELVDSVGVSSADFLARQLTAQMVKDSDLVLPLTVEHRSKIVQLVPASVRKTFTLLEFARIVGNPGFPELQEIEPADRLREMIFLAPTLRRLGSTLDQDDDVPDPYRRGEAVFKSSFNLIFTAVDVIVSKALEDSEADRY